MSPRKYLVLAVAIATGWWVLRPAPAAAWLGRPAPDAPVQTTTNLPPAWKRGDYTITPLARFEAQAVVLSRCTYRGGHDGDLCRTDFALGWGPMSDAAVINALKISQDMRWYFYEWRGELPVPASAIAAAAANMHLIPASDDVRRALQQVKRHELVTFSGYLVEARHADGWVWRSSLSRTDTGGGACEVVWVEKVEHTVIPARS